MIVNFPDHPLSIEGLRLGFLTMRFLNRTFKTFALWPLTSRLKILSTVPEMVLSAYPSVRTSSPTSSGSCPPSAQWHNVHRSSGFLEDLHTATLTSVVCDKPHCGPVSSSKYRNLNHRTCLRQEQVVSAQQTT